MADWFLRNRLAQFLVLGGLIFAIAPRSAGPETIRIDGTRLAALRDAEAKRPGAHAPPAEVDERAVEDEILYREGVRLGLDKNDGVVRQRVVQKVLFFAEEMAGATRPPDESDLRAFFEHNRERWAIGETFHLAQIYRHEPGDLAAWMAGAHDGDPPRGEPCAVGPEIDGTKERLTAQLGGGFVDSVESLPQAQWRGPVRSAFGWHLVRVIDRHPGRLPDLDEVRGAVVEAYGVFRRQEATAAFLRGAFARYRVSVDGQRIESLTPLPRVAFRTVPSGED